MPSTTLVSGHAKATPVHEVDCQSEGSSPVTGHKQSNWKILMVAALTATEKALDGLPVPAAKICISLVLRVLEATDVSEIP